MLEDKILYYPLFSGIAPNELKPLLNCLQSKNCHYEKNQIILLAGNPISSVGIILTGTVKIIRTDFNGKENLITELNEGELFGEVLACAGISCSPVTVLAANACNILHINYRKVISTCSSSCLFHNKLIENMLCIIAKKNLILNHKIDILSKHTIRERIMLFLLNNKNTQHEFEIAYNREELATYLCVDRSALSAELSKMQIEGIICYKKNKFKILKEI